MGEASSTRRRARRSRGKRRLATGHSRLHALRDANLPALPRTVAALRASSHTQKSKVKRHNSVYGRQSGDKAQGRGRKSDKIRLRPATCSAWARRSPSDR
eukprot:5550115-Pleurochrysis_carterae.AAC.8